MKKNCWLILGSFIATSVVAQVNTNTLPEIPDPAVSAETPAVAVDTAAPAVAETPATPAAPAAPVKKAAPKKKRVVKKLHEPTVSLVPGPAVVTAHHLNVRGQAGLHGERVGQLNGGEMVTVISQINLDKHAPNEPAQWAKIALPSGTKVWVSSHFVDTTTKTVTARRLNLRAGPGENYSVIGTVERGTPVTEIETKGAWIQIQPPTDAFAFVAAMYLDQTAIASAQTTPPATTTPTPVPAPMTASTTPAPVPPPTTSTTVAETQPVIASPSGTESQTSTLTPSPEEANATTMAMAPETRPTMVNTNPPPPRVATHEGYVRSSISPVAPTAYELYDPTTGNAINYLYSSTTNLDLSRYDQTKIIVTGEEGLAARWGGTPVLTVQRIYVVSTNPPVPYQVIHSPRASQKNIPGTKREKRH